ncbi:hypothetical protein CONPUDRAFT_155367 [Coniophora puteana RWD-64-598 SS2]|uniref:Glucose-methanol-choline oxidoreductase C-terminal domain-containing protein n=1 Tax=Coniophora puteana (strain RWD-64-598) TaxID=741705 RepID=A0A5M3MLL1_CONPW|nr:uncharacterized protein CONPUDRAFT_155367 [Coniophora puteana RWD-64-598 SS2]EIW79983.1 hypothetical protein CONPUDRAFT_155367 [Coniophora puteana RWD-64-598 SS2]
MQLSTKPSLARLIRESLGLLPGYATPELKVDVKDITLDILRDPEARKEQVELHKKAEGAFTLAITGFAFTPMHAISDCIKDVYALAKKKILDEWDTYSPGLQEQYKIQLQRLEDPNSSPGEFVLVPGFLSHPNPPKPGKKYFTILLCLNHNFSRGTIHSVSSDPNGNPECDPHYFEHDVDLQTFVELAKFVRKMAKTSPLRDILVDEPEVNPGPDCDDSQLAEWLKTTSATTYHTVGSLSMLPNDKGGVVDPNLKVYGTTNVRVADLSIIPLHFASHTLTTAYAIGAQAADIIARAHK